MTTYTSFPLLRWAKDKIDSYRFLKNIKAVGKRAIQNGTADMSMEEIDAEIDIVRTERMERENAQKQHLKVAQG